MTPDMRKGVDDQRPGDENMQAPRAIPMSDRIATESRSIPVDQEDRRGSSGSITDNTHPSPEGC